MAKQRPLHGPSGHLHARSADRIHRSVGKQVGQPPVLPGRHRAVRVDEAEPVGVRVGSTPAPTNRRALALIALGAQVLNTVRRPAASQGLSLIHISEPTRLLSISY